MGRPERGEETHEFLQSLHSFRVTYLLQINLEFKKDFYG